MERLRELSKSIANGFRGGDSMPTICIAQESVDISERPTDLSRLAAALDEDVTDLKTSHERIVWVEACLRNPLGITESTTEETQTAFSTIINWLIEAVRPPQELFGWRSPISPDPSHEVDASDISRYRLMTIAGLRALSLLLRLDKPAQAPLSTGLLKTLISFMDVTDPWTCAEAHELASNLLAAYASNVQEPQPKSILALLDTVVKPEFSSQKQSALAPSGRAALTKSDVDSPLFQTAEADEKPWKFHNPWIVNVFLWCVERVDASVVNSLWPQLTPPALALMDDGAVHFKVRGCRALRAILDKVDSGMLDRTGLGTVFEEALVPMLNLLPSLTKEEESMAVLTESYKTLRKLAEVRFSEDREKRLKCLDTMMRAGVIRGYSLAGDYPRIATLLAVEMDKLVKGMSIDGAKHLKVILPILVDNLCNPFATAFPDLLTTSGWAVLQIMVTFYKILPRYAGLITKGVTVCWCRIGEEEGPGIEEAKKILRRIAGLMQAQLPYQECSDLLQVLTSDERLRSLIVPEY